MRLLVSDTSPYARKCRILLRELDLLHQVRETDAHPFQDGETLLAANPLGRVPCLIMADGRALTESTVIAAYLNELADAPWTSNWDDRRLEALGTGLIDLAVGRRVEMVRDEALYSDYWLGRRERGIGRALDQLETECSDGLARMSLGALTVAVALSYLDFRFPEANWRKARPNLLALYQDWAAREAFAQTEPPADA